MHTPTYTHSQNWHTHACAFMFFTWSLTEEESVNRVVDLLSIMSSLLHTYTHTHTPTHMDSCTYNLHRHLSTHTLTRTHTSTHTSTWTLTLINTHNLHTDEQTHTQTQYRHLRLVRSIVADILEMSTTCSDHTEDLTRSLPQLVFALYIYICICVFR